MEYRQSLILPLLQTIKNSDLEYIKELGSGTYGTVYHGKWKGSDVAIKKIKPSCFGEGLLEEDRLVISHLFLPIVPLLQNFLLFVRFHD